VIELKTNGPVVNLEGLPGTFNKHVSMVNSLLAPMGGRLMPTSMHPWMDPGRCNVRISISPLQTTKSSPDFTRPYASFSRSFRQSPPAPR
jgi:hypothetical protein